MRHVVPPSGGFRPVSRAPDRLNNDETPMTKQWGGGIWILSFVIEMTQGADRSCSVFESQPITAMKTTLAPLLNVRKGSEAIDFYKAAFGAKELFRISDPDGNVVAQLAIDDAVFWLADESPEHLNFSPPALGGSTFRMVLVVEDPDAVFNRAITAGATSISPVADQAYGWRVGRVADPFGHHWEIGKPLRTTSA
jgi:PhnB protein